jgi:hypothetical protein
MKKNILVLDSCGLGSLCGVAVENAFIALLLSSAEVYKSECLGFLLGYKLEDRFIVEHAFSFQTASRKLKGVISNDRSISRSTDTGRFDRLQIIGDFIPIPSLA